MPTKYMMAVESISAVTIYTIFKILVVVAVIVFPFICIPNDSFYFRYVTALHGNGV
jgi:hypothetical protein